MGIGGALTAGLLGGAVGAASGHLDQLREQAKEAKEMRMATFQQKGRMELQEAGDVAATGRLETTIGAEKEAAGLLAGTRAKEFGVETGLKQQQLGLQERQLKEQMRATDLASQTQKDLVSLRQQMEEKTMVKAEELKLDTQGKQVEKLMGDLKDLNGFKAAAPPTQNAIEMYVRINGKLPEDLKMGQDGSMSILVPGTKDLKGASAKNIGEVMDRMEADPVFARKDPSVKFFIASRMAIAAENGLSGAIEGVKDIPDDKVVEVAQMLRSGKNLADAMTEYSPSAIAKIEAAMEEIGKMEKETWKKDVSTPSIGVLEGPKGGTIPRRTVAGTPGRQAIEAIERAFSGDPTKMIEGDTEVTETQRRAADIYR